MPFNVPPPVAYTSGPFVEFISRKKKLKLHLAEIIDLEKIYILCFFLSLIKPVFCTSGFKESLAVGFAKFSEGFWAATAGDQRTVHVVAGHEPLYSKLQRSEDLQSYISAENKSKCETSSDFLCIS